MTICYKPILTASASKPERSESGVAITGHDSLAWVGGSPDHGIASSRERLRQGRNGGSK